MLDRQLALLCCNACVLLPVGIPALQPVQAVHDAIS